MSALCRRQGRRRSRKGPEMSNGVEFAPPEIPDGAVSWACKVLGLPATAFSGPGGDDARMRVLRSLAPGDIEACPGSGKTTLLVAKLAILGGQWREARRGLCVLSHTNVARREIERKLGSTAEGQRLLSYPHFIGTIHGFVNEFLAIPWLRSRGYPIEMIDDEICQSWRWKRIPQWLRDIIESASVHKKWQLHYSDSNFNIGKTKIGQNEIRKEKIRNILINVCEKSSKSGFFCHDEMFIWAHDLLDKVPAVTEVLRARFPLVFIDEVQDNSEQQSVLVHRVFMQGDDAVVRQRYGDANQAIYQYDSQSDGAATDRFPDLRVRTDIPNSHRFGQEIADLADPLALEPQGLEGVRQPAEDGESDTTGKHAIFLFDDETVGRVLETYAGYLIDVFSGKELREGWFTAVGAIHAPTGDDRVPRHVGHYWPKYDYEISRGDPQPSTFVQYVSAGRRLSEDAGEAHAMVEKIAEGVIRLGRIAGPGFSAARRKRRHRYVLELLEEQDTARAAYIDLVRTLAVERSGLTEQAWHEEWCLRVRQIVEAIIGTAPDGPDVEGFLTWGEGAIPVERAEGRLRSDNVFRYPSENPAVAVRVGSIHGVKGETHTATLVLETFHYEHHLQALKAWLLGEKAGGRGASKRVRGRLKLHYVAVTRPARLLCLAMREDGLAGNEITKLRERGWRVARVTGNGPEWLEEGEAADGVEGV